MSYCELNLRITHTFTRYGLADDTTNGLVQAKHVQEYPCDLGEVETANGGASRNIRLQHVRKNLNVVHTAQNIHILRSLGHKGIPLLRTVLK